MTYVSFHAFRTGNWVRVIRLVQEVLDLHPDDGRMKSEQVSGYEVEVEFFLPGVSDKIAISR